MTTSGFSVDWTGRDDEAPEPAAAPELVSLHPGPDGTTGAVLCGDGVGLLAARPALAGAGLDPLGRARLVYLDPPYNRGGHFGAYDDNVPRHEWLTGIERRLRLAYELLDASGTVWVHLDDAEAHRVRCVLDEVFGEAAFIADLTVESNPKGRQLDRHFAGSHDRLMVYARDPGRVRLRSALPENVDPADFPLVDADGVRYRLLPLRNTNKRFHPGTAPSLRYPLYGDPETGTVSVDPVAGATEILPVFGDLEPAVWRWSADLARERVDELLCRVVNGRRGRRIDVYQKDRHFDGRAKKLKTVWLSEEVGSTDSARLELRRLGLTGFRTPKPEALLSRILGLATDPGDLVVDPYAGSGTTAVVARALGRDWIAVELNAETVETVLLPRLAAGGGAREVRPRPGC